MSQKTISIPYCEAGLIAFEIRKSIAEQRLETGQREVSEFIEREMPQSKKLNERYENGKYIYTVRSSTGRSISIGYDYRTKKTEILQEIELEVS